MMRTLACLLMIVFFYAQAACAGGSIGFSVSCTIPAIPGVNAPLSEEPQEPESKKTEQEQPEISDTPSDQFILLAKEDGPVITYYSR